MRSRGPGNEDDYAREILPPPQAFQKYKIVSNFNLRTGILITGCMACGGGSGKLMPQHPIGLSISRL
jgi:hypothetical protein